MNLEDNVGNNIPLCVDLDGTLIASDTLLESTLKLIKQKPLLIFSFLIWILHGKLYFKQKVHSYVLIDASTLPYRKEIIEFIIQEQNKGREIVLATASLDKVANLISEKLGLFSNVIASNENFNYRSTTKRDRLVELYGYKQFDYIGDSKADLKVWEAANSALLVEPSNRLLKKAKKISNVSKVFESKKSILRLIIKEIRVYQWVKNLLLFIPLFMAHKFSNIDYLLNAIIAFFSFSFSASFVYVLNDLLDIDADRNHPRKKNRPIASGDISIKFSIIILMICLLIGISISLFLDIQFIIILILYILATCSYSFILKRIYIVDIITLAGLYTIRIISGALAIPVEASFWLLAFSMFIFLSLATVKRYTELQVIKHENKKKTSGRGYVVEDIELIQSIGLTSGYLSVLVFALYVNSKEVIQLYNHPELLWAIVPCLLAWITRIWFIAHRDKMHDDPIVFTVSDKSSYIIGLFIILLIIGASI